jgi:hypothetical protein
MLQYTPRQCGILASSEHRCPHDFTVFALRTAVASQRCNTLFPQQQADCKEPVSQPYMPVLPVGLSVLQTCLTFGTRGTESDRFLCPPWRLDSTTVCIRVAVPGAKETTFCTGWVATQKGKKKSRHLCDSNTRSRRNCLSRATR